MSNTLKKRVTISLDTALYARLDKRNRSGHIENIIREHYQLASFDVLYKRIKQQLKKEGLLGGGIKEPEQTVIYKGMTGTPSQFSLPPIPNDMQGMELYWDHYQNRYREVEL